MWFWIVLIAFFLTLFLVTRAVVRNQGGVHPGGVQQGYDVTLSGGWDGPGDGSGGLGDGGWGAGDGGGW